MGDAVGKLNHCHRQKVLWLYNFFGRVYCTIPYLAIKKTLTARYPLFPYMTRYLAEKKKVSCNKEEAISYLQAATSCRDSLNFTSCVHKNFTIFMLVDFNRNWHTFCQFKLAKIVRKFAD